MKSISTLMRAKTSIESTCRRTYGNANMVKRKDLRRLKKINIYNKEISGQSNNNPWFIPKRLKAMGNTIETRKNIHIGTSPVSVDLQKEFLANMPELSEHQYYIFRNREQQLIEYKEFIENSETDELVKKLPAKMRKEVENAPENPPPQLALPLLKYIEQLQVYLPQDERYRYNLIQKIQHPPKAKIQDEY